MIDFAWPPWTHVLLLFPSLCSRLWGLFLTVSFGARKVLLGPGVFFLFDQSVTSMSFYFPAARPYGSSVLLGAPFPALMIFFSLFCTVPQEWFGGYSLRRLMVFCISSEFGSAY